MKTTKTLVIGIVLTLLAGTGLVSGMSFDGISDVDITDHTGEAHFGYSVANAGDLNGDGYTDIVIGACYATKAFVYYGGPGFDGISDVDITDHTGEFLFGCSVANAGDLNGDGYTDLVIGAIVANKAFVYYGGPGFDGISDVDITDHTGEEHFGHSVANAGDLNGDGYTDLVIGAPSANKSFVYYGGPSFDGISDVDITDHTGEEHFGHSVANAGDLNDDGYTDLVIGAPSAGGAFVYYGGPGFDGISDVDITDHTGECGFGSSVANAGDLNNDGYTDLAVGGVFGIFSNAFVYYGGPGFDGVSDVDIADHAGDFGFGASAANAGDLNNDGYTDLVIGSTLANKVFVYNGGPGFDGVSDVDITDHIGESYFGCSVANAGDMNNDGYTDLVIGAYLANKAFVYYGGPGFVSISISTDRTTYTTGDIMDIEIDISNPSGASRSVTFGWWLTIPSFDYMTIPIATIPMTLPAGYDETFTYPIYVGYWGEESFGAVWCVALSDPKTEEIVSFDATYWNYVPSEAAQVKKSPTSIAREIRKEIERVELPS